MNRREFLQKTATGCAWAGLAGQDYVLEAGTNKQRPNIVLILVDDMGYSDIGCYGGEISTPNIDKLAGNGLRFTQFYNTARCCPTRASLMTGLYPHQTGVGHMVQDFGEAFPGYRGVLNRNCLTIAEALKPVGYHTYMSGKWHLAGAGERMFQGREYWPRQRGFDRYYGFLSGAVNYFRPEKERGLTSENSQVESVPEDFYTTDVFTQFAIRCLTEQTDDAPFFLYIAYNAPHWPLHAPPDLIEKNRGRYACGWDSLRQERNERMIKLGIIDPSWKLSEANPDAGRWQELSAEERERQDKAMAIYAAMIERVDENIGRLIQTLKQKKQLDHTLILFLADNGGCAEGGLIAKDKNNQPVEKWGSIDSFPQYGLSWANASNTPFKLFKHFVHEGGIATPLIAHYPAVIPSSAKGKLNHQMGHLIDIMATCIDAAGASYPASWKGQFLTPLEGKSLMPIIKGQNQAVHDTLFWEHEDNKALRIKEWKLVQRKCEPWELYNLKSDRSETMDLAAQYPERVEEMKQTWLSWAKLLRVLPKPEKK